MLLVGFPSNWAASGRRASDGSGSGSRMNTTEWLMMAQTGVLFCTAIVVAIYTRETYLIRKQTDEQLAFTNAALRPAFEQPGGSIGIPTTDFQLRNTGGVARHLSVTAPEGTSASIHPTSVQTGDQIRIMVEGLSCEHLAQLDLRIQCRDILNRPVSTLVTIHPAEGNGYDIDVRAE